MFRGLVLLFYAYVCMFSREGAKGNTCIHTPYITKEDNFQDLVLDTAEVMPSCPFLAMAPL